MFDSSVLAIISTLLMVPAIIGIAWWAFAPRRKRRFRDAAQLPFADDPASTQPDSPKADPSETDDPDSDQETNDQDTGNGDGTDERN